LHRFLDQLAITVFPVNPAISQHALFLMEEWRLSHQMFMADALIVAISIEYDQTLLTGNHKHYAFIPNISVKVFKP